ncbi:hypothetical protein [Brevibacillus sp. BC25]|uniref:hypothetical protein n=1 Tax=Brevibacillus sp. BC25 TaxID=1144308 RepID=UPI000270E626|nr:hypothetical protein [Brevibacillus sp. BC25]EJL22792.1 hypothetical protein PMI05_04897 [Brevibacillus sp. BC25]
MSRSYKKFPVVKDKSGPNHQRMGEILLPKIEESRVYREVTPNKKSFLGNWGRTFNLTIPAGFSVL